jgi:hypothetical protein
VKLNTRDLIDFAEDKNLLRAEHGNEPSSI